MPLYTFECYSEDGGCGQIFDISCGMNEISTLPKPLCPNCNDNWSVSRNFNSSIYVFDSSPRTVGALAERNTNKISEDQKIMLNDKHTSYKKPFTGNLPKGGSLFPVDKKGKIIPSNKKHQRKKNNG